MKTVTIDLLGEERLLCYSLGADLEISKKFGNVAGFGKIMSGKDAAKKNAALADMANILSRAGARYETAQNIPPHKPLELTAGVIETSLSPWDYVALQGAVVDALSKGNRREVGAEPPKNALATPGETM